MVYKSEVQVKNKHYNFKKYNRKEPWLNFWYQIIFVLSKNPKSVLEIGPGNKTVTNALLKEGVVVTTVDIDESLKPDIVASVDNLPLEDNSFDLVLCSEVLEHLPYDRFSKSLRELNRISKKDVVLCLPNAGGVFLLSFKFPIFKKITIFFKLPFFWKKHVFNGEHYWETGKKGYQISKIKKDIQLAGFKIRKVKIHCDDPAHCFFVLEK